MFDEIVQEQSMAHLQPRDLSSKYVQIAGPINSLNSSKQLLPPSCCLAIVQMPEQPGNRLSSQAHGPWAQLLVCFFAKHGHQLPRVGDDQRTDIQALQFPTLGSPPAPACQTALGTALLLSSTNPSFLATIKSPGATWPLM